MSEELVTEELADWEAEHEPGGHWAIRNHHIRSFWWTAFAGKDETTWDRFWAQFPKHLRDKCDASCMHGAFMDGLQPHRAADDVAHVLQSPERRLASHRPE